MSIVQDAGGSCGVAQCPSSPHAPPDPLQELCRALRQWEKAEASCALPFLPRDRYLGSSEGEELSFVPQRRQIGAASLAGAPGGCSRGRGLQGGRAGHTAMASASLSHGLCSEGTSPTMAWAQRDGQCPNTQMPVLKGPRPPSALS